jgi:hypothetical protein
MHGIVKPWLCGCWHFDHHAPDQAAARLDVIELSCVLKCAKINMIQILIYTATEVC